MQGSLRKVDIWHRRGRTLRAMAWLVLARLLVLAVPFSRWRLSLGGVECPGDTAEPLVGRDDAQRMASQLAGHVERAAWRLPFAIKCLPKAMALSWMLRRAAVQHCVVIAARPMKRREPGDALHAWVEVSGKIVIGDLPGPWHEIYRAGRQGVV